MKILLVSSTGGHYSELNKIKLDEKYEKYVACEKSKNNKEDKNINYYLLYGSRSNLIKYFFIFSMNFIKTFYILYKVKPKVIISTGAHTCVPFFWLAKIFKIKTIYIESYAKVNSPSLTYKLINKFCTKVIVQHRSMLDIYKDSEYFGGIY